MRRLLGAGAAVGAVAAWGLDGGPLGLGFAVFVAAVATALLKLGGREGWQTAAGQRWLVLAALTCSGFVVLRDNGTLVALDALMALGLLGLAARSWTGEVPISDVSLGGLISNPMITSGQSMYSGAHLLVEAQENSRFGSRIGGAFGPLVRLFFIAGPVVGLVTILLAVGDASFGQRISMVADRVVALPVTTAVRVGFVFAVVTPIAGGWVAYALRRREHKLAPAAPKMISLGATESFGLVGGLAVVALAYGLNSAECALSPNACVLPSSYTYAMYAREGFFQLLVAAGITLGVLIVVPPRASLATASMRSGFRVVCTLLVLATLPMLASAFRRLGLYEASYGFTGERVAAQACSLLIALMLAWRGVTLWTWPWRFGVGALASTIAVLIAMNLFNPDAFIARENLARTSTSVVVDRAYLSTLSADATPVLKEAGIYPVTIREDSFAGFNFARAAAR
ncbi:MAG: DUF4173 domain-containing protein [Myxococcaceae bacterium]